MQVTGSRGMAYVSASVQSGLLEIWTMALEWAAWRSPRMGVLAPSSRDSCAGCSASLISEFSAASAAALCPFFPLPLAFEHPQGISSPVLGLVGISLVAPILTQI